MRLLLCIAVLAALGFAPTAPGPARADDLDPLLIPEEALSKSSAPPLRELAPAEAARLAIAPRRPGPPTRVDLGLEYPDDGTVFSFGGEAYLAGRIDAPLGTPGRVDAIFVLDVSGSTERPTRPNVDRVRERVRGTPRERDVSILRTELESARILLSDVDPRDTRIGLIAFSAGDRFDPPRPGHGAWTEVTLTRDTDVLAEGLDRIEREGAGGSTNMAGALDRAVDELVGRGWSKPDPEAQPVVVFFTDGTPTHPHAEERDNEIAVLHAAERAAAHGVRVFSFAVGPEALARPLATVEMARRTGGVFTPVRRAQDLNVAVQSLPLRGLEEFAIENLTRQRGAHRMHLSRDGRFDALVPLVPGRNRLRVRAVVAGIPVAVEREVHYAPGSARAFIPAELEERRSRLSRKGGRELEVAAGEDAAIRRSIEADRERIEADAARQLRELTVDVASPPPSD